MPKQRNQMFLFDSDQRVMNREDYFRRIYGEPFSTFWKASFDKKFVEYYFFEKLKNKDIALL